MVSLRFAPRMFVMLWACFALIPQTSFADPITQIAIKGNQRIEQSAIENYLGLKRGDDANRAVLDKALKRLYDTGFFSDIIFNFDAGTLHVDVTENPSINQLVFEGNDKIDSEDLEKEVTLKPRAIYTRTKVQSDLKRLLDVYRRNGRYTAEINPKIIPLEQNRVNLVFEINEGPKATIQKVTFIGNDSFDSSDLAKAISSSESKWYQFLSSDDHYDPDRLQYDQELLRKFYYENGYADFKVKSAIAELSPQRDAFYLTFTVEEGPVYKFGKISVDATLPKSKLPDFKEAITTKKGETYNASEVESSVDAMTSALGDKGFAFVDIQPEFVRHKNGNEHTIDLSYTIKEGPRVYVEKINIFGNVRTLDEVIRREFRLTEGDPYSTSKLKRSEQRLNNLGYFETVSIKESPGSSKDRTQLDVEVAEKSTGEVTFGAGFSTNDGALADVGIRERNLLGRGQELSARTLFAARRKEYTVGFTEPYFLDRELSAGFNLFKTSLDLSSESSYDSETTGGTVNLGYALTENWQHQLRYTYQTSRITNIQFDASRYILDQQGSNVSSIVGHSFIFDNRDNKFNPNRGFYASIAQDFAGLGGDDKFVRHEGKVQYYHPIAKKWVLGLSGTAGNIVGIGSEDVRINQRFFIGSQEIRGFRRAGLGPRDTTTEDALGGNNYYVGSAEVRFPLGLPEELGVTGAVFNDVGSLWGLDSSGVGVKDENSLRASAGAGVAWASPFGPIRIDFARAYLKETYDEDELVRFSFGTRF